jgi:hypothetical protein
MFYGILGVTRRLFRSPAHDMPFKSQDTELLDLCSSAGLRQAFVGIETPDATALLEVKKRRTSGRASRTT